MVTKIALLSAALLALQDFDTEKLNHWHQWRGPLATGVAPNGDPPANWNEQTNVKWKTPIEGEGSSTPIVWGDRVFVVSAIETDRQPATAAKQHPDARTQPPAKVLQFVVWCFDRNRGNVIWKKVATEQAPHEGRHPSTTYAAASPTTDGNQLYVSFGSFGVYCYDLESNLKWKRDLGNMRTRRGWGEAVSPVAHDQFLVVNWDQEDQSKIFVLDKQTGETRWEKSRDEPTTWATPLTVSHKGKTQLITNGTNRVRSYDLAVGRLIWDSGGTTLNAIPSPVLYRDHVILMSGYRGNLAKSISLDTQGATDPSHVNWTIRHSTPYVPSPLLVGKRLYFTKSNQAILSCLDAETGSPIYGPQRLPGLQNMYASPAAAGGRIYLTSREGTTLVIKDSDDFEILSTNQLNEGIDASPAIAGKQIFLRGRKHLYCIEEIGKSTK